MCVRAGLWKCEGGTVRVGLWGCEGGIVEVSGRDCEGVRAGLWRV